MINLKRLLLLLSIALILSACGSDNMSELDERERSNTIKNAETMEYLGRLLDPYLDLSNLETEEQMYKVVESIDENARKIKRELKRDFEKDIPAVDDLIVMADMFTDLANEIANENTLFIKAFGEDIGNHIHTITTEYLDGDLPDNYAKVIGVDNIYDLK